MPAAESRPASPIGEPNSPYLMTVRFYEYFNVFSFDSCGDYGYISVSAEKM